MGGRGTGRLREAGEQERHEAMVIFTPMTDALGWLSSFVLVLTIAKQVHKQWRERTSEGVSPWLFVGQITASVGFTVYSWMVRNWVFVVTNALLLVSALVGIVLVIRFRGPSRA
jgi:MtN3 and saliva related transmembrane protein